MTDTELGRDDAEPAAHRYAAGRMNEEEERNFEIAMLEDSQLATKVDVVHRMRAGFRRLDERGELKDLINRRSSVSNPIRFAAAIGVLALIGFLAHNNGSRKAPPMMSGSFAQLASRSASWTAPSASYFIAHARGKSGALRVAVSHTAAPIRLSILPDNPATGGRYRLELRNAPNSVTTPQASVEELEPDKSGVLTVFLDASNLVAGDYLLTLTHANRSEQYPIHIELLK